MPKLSDTEKRAFQAFVKAYAVMLPSIAKELRSESKLSIEEYDVLVTLEYAEGHKLRPSELADRVLLTRSGLTRLLDRLETKGYVQRVDCSKDKRSLFAVLTPAGLEAREEAWPVLQNAIHEHFVGPLSKEELRDLAAACGQISNSGSKC